MRWLCLLIVGVLSLVGCSSQTDVSKAAICTKAVGVMVAAEASDDAQNRLRQAQSAASELQKLSTQTSDTSLSAALSSAAATAGQASSDWSPTRLAAWVTQEQARFDAVTKACA